MFNIYVFLQHVGLLDIYQETHLYL